MQMRHVVLMFCQEPEIKVVTPKELLLGEEDETRLHVGELGATDDAHDTAHSRDAYDPHSVI